MAWLEHADLETQEERSGGQAAFDGRAANVSRIIARDVGREATLQPRVDTELEHRPRHQTFRRPDISLRFREARVPQPRHSSVELDGISEKMRRPTNRFLRVAHHSTQCMDTLP